MFKYIVFEKNKKNVSESSVKLYDEIIERVSQCKYLGIVLTDNMSNTMDSDRVLNKFLRQYNSMYHRFNFASTEVIYHLFKGADPLILVKISVFFSWKIVFIYGVIMS